MTSWTIHPDSWTELWRAILLSLRAAPVRAAAAIILTLFMAIQLMAAAVLLGAMTNAVLASHWNVALAIGAALGGLIGVGLIATWAGFGMRTIVEEKTLVLVDASIVRRSCELQELTIFEQPELADELTLLRRDRARLGNVLIVLMTMLGGCLQLVVTVVLLINVSPALTLVPALGIVPLLVSQRAEHLRQTAITQAAESEQLAAEWARIGTSPEHAPELAVSGISELVQAEYAAAVSRSMRTWHSAERRATVLILLGNCVFSLGYLGAITVAALSAAAGRGPVGNVILVAVLASQVGGEVSLISSMAAALRAAQTVAGRYRRLLHPPAARSDGGTRVPPETLSKGITLRGLTFRYPGASTDALHGIDLDLIPGQTVALVGENGAGKSTLIKILCRFYPSLPGTVLVDGQSLDDLEPDQWRARLAAAFQEPARFSLTAQEAIGIGDLPRADNRTAVMGAIEAAGVGPLLDVLPHGLDTELGGLSAAAIELSGGQWQQLSLARAMMRPSPLAIFLDEPVSALDVGTESRLLSGYARAARFTARRATVGILVTHRLAAARIADQIVVLRDGRAVERGNHDELVALGGEYANMFAAQARGYE